MRHRCALLLAAAWTVVPTAVWANAAAPPPPATLTGPGSAARTPLVVRAADLVIDCAGGAPDCRLEVTYDVHNPSAEPAGGTAAFYAVHTEGVTITVDGNPAGRPLTTPDEQAFDAWVAAAGGETHAPSMALLVGLARHGFDLMVAPGGNARVAITGTVHRRTHRSYGLAQPAARARHLLLAPPLPGLESIAVQYFVAPILTWGAVPEAMTFTLRHPAGWTVAIDGAAMAASTPTGAVVARRGRISTRERLLQVNLWPPRRKPVHLGFLAGIGGHVDNATGLRLRAGIEAGVREDWLASLALELDRGGDDVVLVPAVAFATPWVLIIPSLSAGVGLPLRLTPDLELGGRVQLDAHLGPLGVLMAFDYYPGMAPDPRRFQVSLMAQLSL